MPDPTNDKDIEALLDALVPSASGFGDCDICKTDALRCHSALTALIAERNALKQRVAELEAHKSISVRLLIEERNALRQRVAELEAQPPASDIRERLVCAALTGILAHEGRDREFDCVMDDAIWMAGKALAAMRKGDSDGK